LDFCIEAAENADAVHVLPAERFNPVAWLFWWSTLPIEKWDF
jgi:hypothetical protein